VGAEDVLERFVLSTQFCCEPRIALKIKSMQKNASL
jgi:hypothetical protein